MAIKASRNDVWMAVIDDRAGGAADKAARDAARKEFHDRFRKP